MDYRLNTFQNDYLFDRMVRIHVHPYRIQQDCAAINTIHANVF